MATVPQPYVNVKAYGATGNGTTDDTTAIQAAITAAGSGAVVFFPLGTYKITGNLTTPSYVTLEGEGFYLGAGASPPVQLKFVITGATVGITAGTNITLRNILLRGPGSGVGTCVGVSVSSHVRMENAQFYDWYRGVNLTTSYYSAFTGCEWSSCGVGVYVTSAYNLNFYDPKFVNCPTAIQLASACKPVNIFGGSVENYTSAEAFKDYVGSQWNINGVYFETNSANAVGCSLGAGSSMTLTGCYISIAEVSRFINMSGLTNVTFVAYGNRFGVSSSSITPTAYFMPAGGDIRIFNDDWSDVAITATYATGNYNTGGMPANWDVQSPDDATSQWDTGVHLHGRSIAFAKRTAAPSTPINGAIYLADNSSWDPLLQAGTSPYFVMYDGTGYKFIGSPGIQATTAPASGTWRTGDIVWNSAPTTASAIGFRCTAGGTPGTWETLQYVDLVNAQTVAGAKSFTSAGTIGGSAIATAWWVYRDATAGASTNLTEMRVGNLNSLQGSMALRYTNATAAGTPSCGLYFFPRNNADSSDFTGGTIILTKTAAADTISFSLTGSNGARVHMTAAGNLALCNGTTASARVHLPAGTATASTAPLKLTSGTNLTAAEAGAIEYDGTYMYATPVSTRSRIVTSLVGSNPTYDPPSIAAAGTTTTTVTVTGAALGDYATCSFSLSSAGIMMTAYVSAANTVTVVLFNPTAGAIDLGSGILRCMVVPQ